MTQFQWQKVPPALARDMAEQLGLGRRSSADKLAASWPDGPDEEVIRQCWSILLNRWATKVPKVRDQLVAELRTAGLGDGSLIGRTATSRNDYLRSCRNGRTLRRIVLARFLASHSDQADNEQPNAEVMTSPEGNHPEESLDAKIAHAWEEFGRRLAAAVIQGQDRDTVIVELAPADAANPHEARQSNRFVQWVVFGTSVRCECVGNAYLPAHQQLTNELLARLAEIGWRAALPDDDSINFWIERAQTDAPMLAEQMVRTLRDVYGAPHPAFLRARSFNGDHELSVAGLGIPSASGPYAPPPETVTSDTDRILHKRVVATLSEDLGCSPNDVVADHDGDYPIRSGSAMVFVRVIEEAGLILLMSPLLRDVADSPELRIALDSIEAQVPFVQLSIEQGNVLARAHLIGDPFVPLHLHQLLGLMTRMCDDVDGQLQRDFGGTTFFGPHSQPAISMDGGYL